ncbi:MAG TPA: prolyl oligopeptidase family serine peptidase, partial [Luteimonas sp.]|nr:prolyl oligopeptidase family serine peptidase [Luteimonas sp.]
MPNHILRAAMLGALLSLVAPAARAAEAGVDVDAFVKRDTFESIKISPDGQFFAATAPLADRTVLAILQRADNKVVATFNTGVNTHIAAFEWVNPTRVLISTAEKFGQLDLPQLTGEIYGLSTSGSAEILVGQRVGEMSTGSRIQRKQAETVAAFLVDDLPGDDRNVVIAVSPFSQDPFTRAELMDVDSGKRRTISRAPVRNARFSTDARGTVRFARGIGLDNVNKLYYRAGEASEWRLINDESVTDRVEVPLGFSEDNATAYLQVEQTTGPDAIVAFDVASDTRRQVLRDDGTDPGQVIYRAGTGVPVGVVFQDGKPRSEFFDPKSPEARLHRSLEAAFAGNAVDVTSSTSDGGQALVHVYSDRNAGDFYIFDTVAKKAQHVISSRTWFDPDKMAEMRPVSLAARDGMALHGFLTIPAGSNGKGLPLVVMPHGGPFYVHDAWGFDTQGQILAAAGYAVLQVNFRGSSNYGRAFTQAGARQWGGTMQDDLTDATRWAIREGHADASRICI